ncbi:MmcQ/YjbR family DNA-binding protein [Rufibacter tibetensis]|uniref:MmcQ-like protein n=1 Tax=Rufibacter tibetensis TaxID=512763 RepID=A0A0P0D115_9BACT|nr:MmcQ/YjbR family DNA-binding protein [Rufibacter tibetensis]ALJ00492.1 MmcQ-like protein [Rufibacter tibetensis]
MNIEQFREHCLSKPQVEETLPFDQDTLVFKVAGKMFALCSMSHYAEGVALKCDPERAVDLREQYPAIQPGYHMNKKHWNTISPEAFLPMGLLPELIDHSYNLVVQGLPKKLRGELGL